MADKDPLPAPVVDIRRELAALRATEAPVIFFEAVTTFGTRNGVANMTLEGGMHFLFDGQSQVESRVVAHLRLPMASIAHIRETLDKIELLAQPPASGEKN